MEKSNGLDNEVKKLEAEKDAQEKKIIEATAGGQEISLDDLYDATFGVNMSEVEQSQGMEHTKAFE